MITQLRKILFTPAVAACDALRNPLKSDHPWAEFGALPMKAATYGAIGFPLICDGRGMYYVADP